MIVSYITLKVRGTNFIFRGGTRRHTYDNKEPGRSILAFSFNICKTQSLQPIKSYGQLTLHTVLSLLTEHLIQKCT